MFQRLKGAIDSRIAEEQARQKALPSTLSRSNSAVRSSASPSKRGTRGRGTADGAGVDAGLGKGPDPSEFEKEVVPDEEDSGGAEKEKEKGDETTAGKQVEDKLNEKEDEKATTQEKDVLPTDVRVRLRKLEKLEGRYQGRLRLALRCASHTKILMQNNCRTASVVSYRSWASPDY
jgi:hypothetical protein